MNKKGTYGGMEEGYHGTTKTGNPYTIFNFVLEFPSGKNFKYNLPSWNEELVERIDSELTVGDAVTITHDNKNNLQDFKVTAPVQKPVPPKKKTSATTPAPAPAPDTAIASDPVKSCHDPITLGMTNEERRMLSIKMALEFYKDGNTKALLAAEELAFTLAARIEKYIRCTRTCEKFKQEKPEEGDVEENHTSNDDF